MIQAGLRIRFFGEDLGLGNMIGEGLISETRNVADTSK